LSEHRKAPRIRDVHSASGRNRHGSQGTPGDGKMPPTVLATGDKGEKPGPKAPTSDDLGSGGCGVRPGRLSPARARGSAGFRPGGAMPARQNQNVTISDRSDGLRPAQACGRRLKSPETLTGSDLTQNRLALGRPGLRQGPAWGPDRQHATRQVDLADSQTHPPTATGRNRRTLRQAFQGMFGRTSPRPSQRRHRPEQRQRRPTCR